MFLKERSESEELWRMRSLNVRMRLALKDVYYYLNLEKGFKGEQMFDALLNKHLANDFYVMNDLLLEYNKAEFQIDSLLISRNTIYPIDVKNYEGDFYISGEKWYPVNGEEIKNPLPQLYRSESLIRKVSRDLGYNFSIEPYLTFVNPGFYLYQAPMNLPLIFPTQLTRFSDKLNKSAARLNDTHAKLASQLLSLHKKKSSYTNAPPYTYDQLTKGIICSLCHAHFTVFENGKIVCKHCGAFEDVTRAVLRSVEEHIMLFPERKITTNGIQEWCGVVDSKKTIWRILSQNYKLVGHSASSNYIISDK